MKHPALHRKRILEAAKLGNCGSISGTSPSTRKLHLLLRSLQHRVQNSTCTEAEFMNVKFR